jgi:hypothetical protein
MFIEANPQFKTLNIYDDKLKKVFQETSKKNSEIDNGKEVAAPEKKQEQKKDISNSESDDDSSKKGKKSSKMKVGS